MKTRWIFVVGAVAVLGSLVWLSWVDQPRNDAAPVVGELPARDAPRSPMAPTVSNERVAGPQSRPAAHGSPPSQRLVDQWSSLEGRSIRGDQHASCRLAIELRRCGEIDRLRARARELERIAARAAPGSHGERKAVDEIAHLQDVVSQRSLYCEGIAEERPREAWRYYQRAASQGHRDAMIEYVVAPPLDRRNMLRDIEAWTAYRNSYWALLQEGIRNGDARALFLAFGIAAGTDFVTGAPDDTTYHDDRIAARYGNALLPMLGGSEAQRIRAMLDRVNARLDASALQQAEAEGDQLRETTFGNQPTFSARGALRRTLTPDDC